MSQFTLTSPTINEGDTLADAHVFNDFGCEGGNQSPALAWSNAPEDTKSFAISCYDPDAPTGCGFWHWYLINIPADITNLPTNVGALGGAGLPANVRTMRNDYGSYSYGGACPPKGDKPHRYIFTVYALSLAKIEIPEDATTAFCGFNVLANTIASATLTAYYQVAP